jgi:hypothetical protein
LIALVSVLGVGGLFAAPALAAVPAVSTGAFGSLTYQSAVLGAAVNPEGRISVVYFQYGTTKKYGAQSGSIEVAAGARAVPVAIPVTGLTPGTLYHYRVVATNSSGTALGADRTLTTLKIPLSLAITGAAPNPAPYGAAIQLVGTLSGTGSAGAVIQLQENVFPYTGGFVDYGNPELTLSTGAFTFNVIGAAMNTQFRVVSGTVVSGIVTVQMMVSVTLAGEASGTHQHPKIRFSGVITPAEPGARIAFERLVGTTWRVVGGTVASAKTVNATVAFATTLRIRAGGTFRALALPVEGAHNAGYSGTVVVHLR